MMGAAHGVQDRATSVLADSVLADIDTGGYFGELAAIRWYPDDYGCHNHLHAGSGFS
jgi:hypothetical protein